MEEKQQFEITDLQSLSWVFRKILAPAKKRIAENEKLANDEIERVKKWLEEVNKSDELEVEYWSHRIHDYHQYQLLHGSGDKTLSTPYGKSKSTTSKAQPELADKDVLLSFIKENQYTEFLKIEESAKWGDLKKTLTIAGNNVVDANGQIVEGVKIKPETTTFKLEVSE
ncbi:host-nuclease inhibitor Gam family protein [Sporosarcina sp. Sa2YVA2]|uniref:Host-nuclease inhibitor Gam family protein n=1 Tax=Sporosarcina quadrami TaxID=2762234 RepID=A0ABR8U8U1_9BACL|nr:host-nuclease inhibitor Gam family protein [Sporosarcina quadrami]MBD7984443.1 host-nuclease inhibitor Gam family protein [Sporosarcina quadrami]